MQDTVGINSTWKTFISPVNIVLNEFPWTVLESACPDNSKTSLMC